jgi:hypothetical protein
MGDGGGAMVAPPLALRLRALERVRESSDLMYFLQETKK